MRRSDTQISKSGFEAVVSGLQVVGWEGVCCLDMDHCALEGKGARREERDVKVTWTKNRTVDTTDT